MSAELTSAADAVTLRLPGVLRPVADGRSSLVLTLGPDATLADLLDHLGADYEPLARRLRDERGTVRRHVNVYVDGVDVRQAAQLETPVPPGCEVLVAPAVSGG